MTTVEPKWHLSGLRQRWWVDLLDMSGNLLGTMDGVKSFSLDFKAGADVRGSGSLDITLTGPFEWRNKLCRIWVEVDDGYVVQPYPVMTALMEAGSEARDDTMATVSVNLMDLTIRFDAAKGTALSLPAGTLVTGKLREYLVALGFPNPAITESSKTLASGMYWDAGTTWRKILGDLTTSIGFRPVRADELGNVVVSPYTLPQSRPIVSEIKHGPEATFLSKWAQETNATDIPNHLVVVSNSDGETAALVAERWDNDADSPWSTVSRGRTISRVETNVDAADQTVLEAHADRLWANSRGVTRSLRMDMRWRPFSLEDRVSILTGATAWGEFLSTTATIQGMNVNGAAGEPLSNMQLNLREVA